MAIIPIAKVVSAMAIIQSSTPIEVAARNQTRLFVVYVVVLAIGGIAATLLTVLVYRAGNTYQGAVKADADARIAEAGTKAAEANAEAAKANEGLGKSNEEIARLTTEAEQSKTDRAEADKQIAIAKADAAQASVQVANLQITVANAEKERAIAQLALLELQERIKGRRLTEEQGKRLIEILKKIPKDGDINIECFSSVPDSCAFAGDFRAVFEAAGLRGKILKADFAFRLPPKGLLLVVKSLEEAPPFFVPLGDALKSIGLQAEGAFGAPTAGGPVKPQTVVLMVGAKP